MKRIVLVLLLCLGLLMLIACSPQEEDLIKDYIVENIGFDLDEIHVVSKDSGYTVTMSTLSTASSLQQLCEDAVHVANTYSQASGIVITTINSSIKCPSGDFYGWSNDGLLYSDHEILEEKVDSTEISYYLFLHDIISLTDAQLSEENAKQAFLYDMQQALIDGKNADAVEYIGSRDVFVQHYQKMFAAILNDVAKYKGASFQDAEFQKNFDLFFDAVTSSSELFNSTPYDKSEFLATWNQLYWDMCSSAAYYHLNYGMQIDNYMLQIAEITLVSPDEILPYQGGWTTYKHYLANTKPNVVIEGYECVSLSYDIINRNAVTGMSTSYLFGINPDGTIVMVNSFMQPRITLSFVEDGHIIEYLIGDGRDYYRIEGYSGSVDYSMLKTAPTIGMTSAEVLASTWGAPNKTNTTETAYGIHEQWVYNDRGYIYFDNGIVTAIQKK